MEKRNIDPDTHFYLYAKGHYLMNRDIIRDLKVLVGKRYCLDPEYVDKKDIVNALIGIVVDQVILQGDIKYQIIRFIMEFIEDINPENNWKFIGGSPGDDLDVAVIQKCLSFLRLTSVRYIPFLGEADPNLLVLKSLKNEEE